MKCPIAFCMVLLTGVVCQGGELPGTRWFKEIQTEELAGEELIAVPLDAEIYGASDDQWSDLRIVDSNGNDVPWLVERQTRKQTRKRRETWRAKNISVKPLEDEGLQITVRLDKDDPQPDGLKLLTPLRNFEQRVVVSGTVDGKPNQPLVTDAVVFDYSKYMDVSRREIRLPRNESREFRIVVGALTADQESQMLALTRRLRGGAEDERQERTTIDRRPFRIDRIDLWAEVEYLSPKENVTGDWPVKEMAVSQDDENQQTVIELQTLREPLTKFTLESTSRNFSRRAVVQVADTNGLKVSWRTVGESRISRFEFRDLQEEHLEIAFPEQRKESWRILINNQDSPPLEIDAIRAEGHLYQLVFLAAAGQKYSLHYGRQGNDDTDTPQYDVAAIRAVLEKGAVPVSATVGAATAVSTEHDVDVGQVINNPFVLGIVITLMVAVLAWALFHAGKRIEELPPEQKT